MKKILQKIILVVGILVVGFVAENTTQAQACTISNVNFTDVTDINGATTTLSISSSECEAGLSVELFAINRKNRELVSVENLPEVIFPENNGDVEIEFTGSEHSCYGGNKNRITSGNSRNNRNAGGGTIVQEAWPTECIHFVQIKHNDSFVFNPDSTPLLPADYDEPKKQGLLKGSCNGISCNSKLGAKWQAKLEKGKVPDIQNCTLADSDVFFSSVPQGGLAGKSITLNVKSKNKCDGIPLFIKLQRPKVNIKREPGQQGSRTRPTDRSVDLIGDSEEGVSNDYIEIRPRTGEDLTVEYEINGATCSTNAGCEVAVVIERIGTTTATSGRGGSRTTTQQRRIAIYDSSNIIQNIRENKNLTSTQENSVIIGSCSNCEDINNPEWGFLGTNGITKAKTHTAGTNTQVLTLKKEFDVNSPCFRVVNGQKEYDEDCYELLAPIPGLGTVQADGRSSINLKTTSIGEYVNIVINIVLGLMMVIAVIMIVVAGVEYMTTESLYGKGDAKKRISGAILGLILGLGIYTILNTINPELLEVNFGKDIDTINLEIQDPGEIDILPQKELEKRGYPSGYNETITQKKKTVGIAEGPEKKRLIEETTAGGTLVSLGNSIEIKGGTVQHTTVRNSVATESFKNKLISLNQTLKNKNINIRLTEVFGPTTTKHGSKCHYIGTCVDLATTNQFYDKRIVSEIIRASLSVGLIAQFETSKPNARQTYLEADLHPAYVLPLSSDKITGEHFSIYDAK